MPNQSSPKFARITPVDPRCAGRVLNFWNCLWANVLSILMIVVVAYTVPIPVVVVLATVEMPNELRMILAAVGLVVATTILSLWVAYCFTEWPVNRLHCAKLLRFVELSPPIVSPFDPATRVVEWVTRERRGITRLDTATDLMMMRVDEHGVWMLGDYYRYEIPRESILGAEFHAGGRSSVYRNDGPSPRVVIRVRTTEGAVELPILYRDYRFGSLRLSRRRAQMASLAEKINAIAAGLRYEPICDPDMPGRGTSEESDNPYAVPSTV